MEREKEGRAGDPVVLLVPGLGNSGPGHWQTRWEASRDDCRRVDLGLWDRPHRNTWVNKLNHAIDQARRPVVLAAHSLGCLAVAWWAGMEQPGRQGQVRGALLVAPPEVDRAPLDSRLSGFAPTPRRALPFPSLLVASRNDRYMDFATAGRLADAWGSTLIDAGACGHINAESGLGDWSFGQDLLARLVEPPARGAGRTGAAVACSGGLILDNRLPRAGARRVPSHGFTPSWKNT